MWAITFNVYKLQENVLFEVVVLICLFWDAHFAFVKCNIAEIINLRNLERVLAREEEVKKRAIVHKSVYSGPQIRYSSKNGKLSPILVFWSIDSLPQASGFLGYQKVLIFDSVLLLKCC